MQKIHKPFITFVIPTYNSEKYLDYCLASVRKQEYPIDRYEIYILDAGSKDRTLAIARKYKATIIFNPGKDSVHAKSIALQKSRAQVLVMLDSDNVILKKDWLKKMVEPLVEDPELFGVESEYFVNKNDSIFNTYSMLAHIADPLARAMSARLKIRKKRNYDELCIPEGSVYPLGANGFLWRKSIIEKIGLYIPVFEESNYGYYVNEAGYRKFARVPGYGIYHYHIRSLSDFVQKRIKYGNQFISRKGEKRKTWVDGVSPIKFIFALVYCISFIGPFIEALFNFVKTGNSAWLIHPLMCFISVATYGYVFVKRRIFSILRYVKFS